MLSFIPAPPSYSPLQNHANRFVLPTPSPLSTRDPNAASLFPPSPFKFQEPYNMTTSTTSDPPKHSIFQPVSRLSPSPVATINKRASSAHRRENFLRKNREAREETRFEARSDLAMRRAFVDERRRWEDRLTREAPTLIPEIWEDDEEGDAMDEDEMMEGEGPPDEEDVYGGFGEEGKRDSQEFYDEEYESIFAEIAGREGGGIQCAEEGDRGGVVDTSRETGTGVESKDLEGARDRQLQEVNHDMDMTDG